MRRDVFRAIVLVQLAVILGLLAYIAASGPGITLYCSNSGPGECVTQWQDAPGPPQP